MLPLPCTNRFPCRPSSGGAHLSRTIPDRPRRLPVIAYPAGLAFTCAAPAPPFALTVPRQGSAHPTGRCAKATKRGAICAAQTTATTESDPPTATWTGKTHPELTARVAAGSRTGFPAQERRWRPLRRPRRYPPAQYDPGTGKDTLYRRRPIHSTIGPKMSPWKYIS